MTTSSAAAPVQNHAKYDRLIADAKRVPPAITVVVHPCDETSLRGVSEAADAGIIDPVMVGPKSEIIEAAHRHAIDISLFDIVDAADSEDAAALGVKLIREGKGELLMKGSLHTDELMRVVTATATGLRPDRRIRHGFMIGEQNFGGGR